MTFNLTSRFSEGGRRGRGTLEGITRRGCRGWVQGGSVQAGAWQEDTVREVYGSMSGRNSWIYVEGKGALATTGSTDYFLAQISPGGDGVFSGFDFRLSRSIPTGPITAPPHVWQPVILYLGEKA